MTRSLEESYAYCRGVARKRAKNFYYAFVLLDRPQRDGMCALYAFMRCCDDLSDEPGRSSAALEQWRADLDAALAGDWGDHPLWPAFHDMARRYRIPHGYFHDMIDGVVSDLTRTRIETFEELYHYCYQVASVVGLSVIHVFGFESPEALPLAEKCGIAFQLTNILRDIREDAGLGRVYIPAEDLERFSVRAEDLQAGAPTDNFIQMMRFEAARARFYYTESAPLLDLVHRGSRASLWALIEIYSRLLERIERSNFDVLRRRIRLSRLEKSWIVVRALAGAGRGRRVSGSVVTANRP